MAQAVANPESTTNGDFTAPLKGAPGEPTVESEATTPTFVAAQPKSTGHSITSILEHGHPTRIDATFPSDLLKQTWQQRFSMFVVKILWKIYPLMKLVGFLVEWTINFFVLNHGPFSLLFKLLVPFKWHTIVFPNTEADNYLSIVGQLDPRCDLYVNTTKAAKADSKRADALVFPDEDVGARATADVCVMAAKLAYENPAVVERVVKECWGMHFVKFYNSWNDYQHMSNTQSFVFMDKPTDANAVVVAFRGTEAFNAYDWSTDFDFSWVKLEGLGGVHLGFLEALGLATRDDPGSFTKLRNQARKAHRHTETQEHREGKGRPHHKSMSEIKHSDAISGLADHIIHNQGRSLAYDSITRRVAKLLYQNPRAKLFITGHSLGGALAALYATMLHYTGQSEIASKIGAVYTFGQPRVGDEDFASYAAQRLAGKFFRVVYCNDMVPRIPFDNELFAFKHFGGCAYFNSVYDGLTLREEPNPNFFGIGRLATMHLNALWEVFQGLILITMEYGHDFSESVICLMCRMAGLLLPGVSSHSPCNYVNSVRLGPLPLRVKHDVADLAQEFYLMQDNVKDIIKVLSTAFVKIIRGSSEPNLRSLQH
jgi:hypothetical protein